MGYKIIWEKNPNSYISSKLLYEAQIVVQGKRLCKNRTNFTNEELFEITSGWENVYHINDYTPESYRIRNKNYMHLLIRK